MRLRVVLALVRLDLDWYALNLLILMTGSLMRVLFDGDIVLFGVFWVVALNMVLLRFVQGSNSEDARLLASLPLRRSEVVVARYVEGVGWIAATALLGVVLIWGNAVFGDHSAGMWRSLVGLIVALVVDLVVGLPLVIRIPYVSSLVVRGAGEPGGGHCCVRTDRVHGKDGSPHT